MITKHLISHAIRTSMCALGPQIRNPYQRVDGPSQHSSYSISFCIGLVWFSGTAWYIGTECIYLLSGVLLFYVLFELA